MLALASGIIFFWSLLCTPGASKATSVAELSVSTRQAQSRVQGLKSRGQWGTAEQQQIVEQLGKLAMDFLSATDLAGVGADRGQRAAARNVYDNLSNPLEEIYKTHLSRLDSMSKAVMDQDGDLEALYETPQWKEAQILASQSLYFLNWLHYVGALLHGGAKRKQLLEEAAQGFSEFAVGEQASSLKRESLFARGLCEKELKQYDRAIRDFKFLLREKNLSPQREKKARLSLLETYVQAERMEEALAESSRFFASVGKAARPIAARPEEMARARFLRAQALFDLAKKEKGTARKQHRKEALVLVDQLRQQGGFWRKQGEALAKGLVSQPQEWLEEEEISSFVQWEQAKVLLQEAKYRQAVPLLQEIVDSTDPAAKEHQRQAQYFLGVGLFQQRKYQDAAFHLAAFLNAQGKPKKFGPEAAYLRFKAGEALYARSATPGNTTLYLDTIGDYIRRYPRHRYTPEAHYRLGEYYQKQNEFLVATKSYNRVSRDPEFRLRADFATLQCYFSVLEELAERQNQVKENGEKEEGKKDQALPLSESELHQRVAASLERFWQDADKFEKKSPRAIRRVPLHNYRGRVSVMNAVFLSQEGAQDGAQDGQQREEKIASLLKDFEDKYPNQDDAFFTVAQMRLGALVKLGRFTEAEEVIAAALRRFDPEQQKQLLAKLPDRLLREARNREVEGDGTEALAAKRAVALIYENRLREQKNGEEPLSNQFKYQLAQLYLDVEKNDKALSLLEELQEGAYSLVALAGLGTIAERKGNHQGALDYWEEMLKGTQVGDPLWFRGTYKLAQLYQTMGNTEQACKIINTATRMFPRLGNDTLKQQIQEQVVQSCGE